MTAIYLSPPTLIEEVHHRPDPRSIWRLSSAPPDTATLRRLIERPRMSSLWGTSYRIVPLLVDEVFGDGRQLIFIEPLNTRPNYYVVRIDSGWVLSNWYHGERDSIADHIDDITAAIGEQFGYVDDDRDEHPDGAPWPAFDYWSGESWGGIWWPVDQERAIRQVDALRYFRSHASPRPAAPARRDDSGGTNQ